MAELNARPLNERQIARLATTLDRWAKSHPRPHAPLLGLGTGDALSASDLGNHVRKRTPAGQIVIRMFEFGQMQLPFEEILARLAEVSQQ